MKIYKMLIKAGIGFIVTLVDEFLFLKCVSSSYKKQTNTLVMEQFLITTNIYYISMRNTVHKVFFSSVNHIEQEVINTTYS